MKWPSKIRLRYTKCLATKTNSVSGPGGGGEDLTGDADRRNALLAFHSKQHNRDQVNLSVKMMITKTMFPKYCVFVNKLEDEVHGSELSH